MIRTAIKYILVPIAVWQVAYWLASLSEVIAALQLLIGAVVVIVLLRDRSPDLPDDQPADRGTATAAHDTAQREYDPGALDLDTTALFTADQGRITHAGDTDGPDAQRHNADPDQGLPPHSWTIQAQRQQDNP